MREKRGKKEDKRGRKNGDNLKFSKGKPKRRPLLKKRFEGSRVKPTLMVETDTIRLNRFLANAGICSRREADTLIEIGAVSVNGTVVTQLGTKVKLSDVVKYNGERIYPEKPIYLILNKPKDYITTLDDPQGRKTVLDLVAKACKERIYPVGRLDRNTTGILLFTNDGEFAKLLTHPSHEVKKIYHVFTDKNVTEDHLKLMLSGIELSDGRIKADAASFVGNDKRQIGIELHSGKNRIVRRIFEHLGYNVKKLDRVYFGGITKKDLPRGKWRFITQEEVMYLKRSVRL